MLEDTDSGQLEDIDVIPNEEILLVVHYQCTLDFQKEKKNMWTIFAQKCL